MRVLHVVPALAPRYGGPSTAAIGMCRALLDSGTDVAIASTDADGAAELRVPLGSTELYAGIPVTFFHRRFGEAFKWSAGLAPWLRQHVREFDVAHVHAVFSHSSLAAGAACRRHGVPYLLRPLGTLDPWSVGRKPLRKRVLLACGGNALIAGATAVHYTTREEQRLAESVLRRAPRGVVIPLGIDDGFFAGPRAAADRDRPYVLALSRLDEKKGIDLLIRAFLQVMTESGLERWRLVVAGDGAVPYVAALKALAGSALGSRVVFTGWTDGEAKRTLVQQASLYALPSHQENFGIAVVEAMALGVPVLLTPGVNLAADVAAANAGWVTSERSEAAVRDALRAAMRDAAARSDCGARARTFAARFRWTRVADALNDIYATVAGRD